MKLKNNISPDELAVVILAAGEGSRYGKRKQFELLEGKELCFHVFEKVVNRSNNITFVLNADCDEHIINKIKEYSLIYPDKKLNYVKGGSTRFLSVYQGVISFSKKHYPSLKLIMIMESARPSVTEFQIDQLIDSSKKFSRELNVVSSTFFTPTDNAILNKLNRKYEARDNLVSIQTPQLFDFEVLQDSMKDYLDNPDNEFKDFYEECNFLLHSDDKRLPILIEGASNLLKITRKPDLSRFQSSTVKKSVLITGSTGALGSKLKEFLLEKDYDVYCLDRSDIDFSNIETPKQLEKLLETKYQKIPKIDLLVNNAGFMEIRRFEEDEFLSSTDSMYKANLNAPLVLTKLVLENNPSALIINISSTSGEKGRAGFMGYGISKAGMNIMTQALAEEGYKSYSINPGRMDSKLRYNVFGEEDKTNLLTPLHVVSVVDNIINGIYDNGSVISVRFDESVFKAKVL